MVRAICGAAAGLATGGTAAWYTGDSSLGVCVGSLAAITIWFWAWGRISQPGVEAGGRRGC